MNILVCKNHSNKLSTLNFSPVLTFLRKSIGFLEIIYPT